MPVQTVCLWGYDSRKARPVNAQVLLASARIERECLRHYARLNLEVEVVHFSRFNNINDNTLLLVVRWLKHHRDDWGMLIGSEISEWDVAFFQRHVDALEDIHQAAEYLEIDSLISVVGRVMFMMHDPERAELIAQMAIYVPEPGEIDQSLFLNENPDLQEPIFPGYWPLD